MFYLSLGLCAAQCYRAVSVLPLGYVLVYHSLWPKPFAYSVYLRNMGEAFE